MSITATVEHGVVKLPAEATWADGTVVRIEKIEAPSSGNVFTQRLRQIAARLEGLPPDLAEQHDHYLHGTPKRPRS